MKHHCFPLVKTVQRKFVAEVDTFIFFSVVMFLLDVVYYKLLKLVNFSPSYSKNKNGG